MLFWPEFRFRIDLTTAVCSWGAGNDCRGSPYGEWRINSTVRPVTRLFWGCSLGRPYFSITRRSVRSWGAVKITPSELNRMRCVFLVSNESETASSGIYLDMSSGRTLGRTDRSWMGLQDDQRTFSTFEDGPDDVELDLEPASLSAPESARSLRFVAEL